MNRNDTQLQAAKPLGTVTLNYRPRQFRCRKTAPSISAQNPPRLGYKDERGMLFFEMVKILKEKQPRFFIAENVKGILSANKKKAFPMIVKEFEAAGYTVVYKLLNASDYGIPQKRERVIIVGFRDKKDAYNFAYPQKIKPSEKKVLKDVIIESENNNEKLFFSERAVAGMMAVREKMNKGRVMSLDEPCNTISAHLAKVSLNSTDPVFMVGERYRRFSVREAANIQSFPSTFTLGKVSQCRQYKAIGNAVPPVLMWNVIEELERAISRTKLNKNTSTRRETFERKPHYIQLNFLDMLDQFEEGGMTMVREEEAPYGKQRAKTYATELHEGLFIGRCGENQNMDAFGADAIVRMDGVKLTAANLKKELVVVLNALLEQGAKTIIVPLNILSGLRSAKKDEILAQSLVGWLQVNGDKVNKVIVVAEKLIASDLVSE